MTNPSTLAPRMTVFKVLVSLFVLFHLVAVLATPNSTSSLFHILSSAIGPYTDFFELTDPWAFFAPDPGPPPIYMEWETTDASGKVAEQGRFPEYPSPYFLRERQNRRIAAAEFMLFSEERIQKMMVPYICHQHPEAAAVRLWRTLYELPTPEDVLSGKKKIWDETVSERKFMIHGFCKEESV